MNKDLFEIKGELDVEALMASITESLKEQPGSRREFLAEPSPKKNLASFELEDLNDEIRLALPLADAINQIPLKAKGLKGKLELRIKAFLKWLVHWNTRGQSDFNASLLRSLALLAKHIQSLQRDVAAVEKSAQRDAERNTETTRQIENLAETLSARSSELEQKMGRLPEEIRQKVKSDVHAATAGFKKEWDRNALETRRLREQVVGFSSMLEDIGRRFDSGLAELEAFEQRAGRMIEESTRQMQAESRTAEAALKEEIEKSNRQVQAESRTAEAALKEEIEKSNREVQAESRTAEAALKEEIEKSNRQVQAESRTAEAALKEEIEKSNRQMQTESAAAVAALREEINQTLHHELDEVRMRILRAERVAKAANCAIDSSQSAPKRDAALAKTRPRYPYDKTNGRTESRAAPSAGEERSLQTFDYFMFEHKFRGSASEIKQRQSAYVDLFLDKDNVLDLGCGRGEFLELLSENGINVTGVDNNQDMVDFCLDRGLRVIHADMFDYLSSVPDASLDGIFACQVVEHFPPDEILRLISLSADKLKPGGVFVAETVNTNCHAAMTNFYIDPTHVRPVPAEMLRFMFEQGPYEIESLRFTSPVSGSNSQEVFDKTSGLPREVGEYQDYAVIARRVSKG